jgi:predicted Holliday junction resolvase-like endonuclease
MCLTLPAIQIVILIIMMINLQNALKQRQKELKEQWTKSTIVEDLNTHLSLAERTRRQ